MTITSDSFPPLDEEAALNWLRNASQVETTITALAEAWGWERTRASRALRGWERDGLITRRSGAGRKSVISAVVPPVHGSSPGANTVPQQSAETVPIFAGPAVRTVHAPSATVHTVTQPKARRVWSLNAQSNLMLAAAVGLGSVGLVMNVKFAASFGQSEAEAVTLAVLGGTIDLLALMLPSAGSRLWRSHRRAAGAGAWCLWLFVAGMSLLAGAGFGATNIGDAVADRDRVVHEVVGVRATVDRLRAERTASTETRSTAVLQAQAERERALIDRGAWKATRGCHDVTASDSAVSCASFMATSQAMAAAVQRDTVDAELRTAEEKLAILPGIWAADPQTEMAADIVAWITAGKATFQPRDIARLRIIGLALMPTLAGVVMMLGMALRRASVVS